MVKELFFKITPISAPVVDIGVKPPIISGLAYIKNFYETIFYYWNGQAYTQELDLIEDVRSRNKYYADDVYAGIDDFFEMALYNAIAGADVPAGAGDVTAPIYEKYTITIGDADAIAGGD